MNIRKLFALTGTALVICGGLVACSASTTPASCAFVVGDGQDGNDTDIHKIVYPGQQVDVDASENVTYVPCNSRNYITNDGTTKNANGEKVGDRFQPTVAYTETGVPIYVYTTAYWTLDEADDAMRNFYALCFKYTCGSSDDIGGGRNYSSKGWNGMLGENFGPSIDATALQSAISFSDKIWQRHDPQLYDELGKQMSAKFDDSVRAKTGYAQDLFCGSGNSGWKDPNTTGPKGQFTCTPVRIVVDRVERGPIDPTDNNEGVLAINRQRLANASALYGDSAGFWLGLQDSIEKCRNAGAACVFNIGGTGGVSVPAPATK